MRDDLAAIERRFEAMRSLPPDPLAACAEVLRPPGPGWLDAARAIDRALAAAPRELAYHNRHHFAEATLAMGWLCALACEEGRMDQTAAAAGVLAMLGHDIDHDGTAALDGRLEAISAGRIAKIAEEAGLGGAVVGQITDVILATNPALVASNAAAAGTPAGLLRRLANEADVFASLLPRLGRRLGAALAAERGLQGGAAHQERLAFLKLYSDFSAPAQRLGLADLHRAQVAAFGGEAGAAALDCLPVSDGLALYDCRLAKTRIE